MVKNIINKINLLAILVTIVVILLALFMLFSLLRKKNICKEGFPNKILDYTGLTDNNN